jgi:hypothetical protein
VAGITGNPEDYHDRFFLFRKSGIKGSIGLIFHRVFFPVPGTG